MLQTLNTYVPFMSSLENVNYTCVNMLHNAPVCIFAMYNYSAHKNKVIINIFLYLTFHKSYN